jgi:hypothetical protein
MTNVVTFTPDKPLSSLRVGDVVKVTLKLDGVPLTGGDIEWAQRSPALLTCEPLTGSTVPGQVQKFTAKAEGISDIICVLNKSIWSQPQHVVVAKAVTVTPGGAPAASWDGLRSWLRLAQTDFYYNTTTLIEQQAAKEYDVYIGGRSDRHALMKLINPKERVTTYALQNTCIQPIPGWVYPVSGPRYWSNDSQPGLNSGYSADHHKWCQSHGVSAADEEACWLHKPDGTRAQHDAGTPNARWMPDPRSQVMTQYQVERMRRLAADPVMDGLFFDEFGTGVVKNFYGHAQSDATTMQQLLDAEAARIKEIADAIYPKQLIVNTANYTGDWDYTIAKAARGVHTEQLNYPMQLDIFGTAWPFLDKLFAANVFVNFVPIIPFGGYEHIHDGQATPNYMDTPRGKLLELASAYMAMPSNPALLALSIENGPWDIYNMMSNHIPAANVDIGKPIETRQKPADAHYFTRRFEKGMVVFNPVWNRLTQNYNASITIPLQRDRKYAQVKPDGSVGPVVQTVSLRCPEAAIFVVVP